MKLKHLEHIEDYPLIAGKDGFQYARNTMNAVYQYLHGKESDVIVTTKYDGSPSIVFGHNPENGKFFVATKSAFNVKPKINYTIRDIQNNHDSSGLVTALGTALVYLPIITPNKGVFQGDVMFTVHSLREGSDVISFTPNTITYSVRSDTREGKAISKAKLGIVVHTRYEGKTLQDMHANFHVLHYVFKHSPYVYYIDPNYNIVVTSTKDEFDYYMSYAEKLNESINYDHTILFSEQLQSYINSAVRLNDKPTVLSFKDYLIRQHVKKMGELKSENGQRKEIVRHDANIDHLVLHQSDFAKLFTVHEYLRSAKMQLLDILGSDNTFVHTINDRFTSPEGFVVTYKNVPCKLVDRYEFSKLNFERSKMRK